MMENGKAAEDGNITVSKARPTPATPSRCSQLSKLSDQWLKAGNVGGGRRPGRGGSAGY